MSGHFNAEKIPLKKIRNKIKESEIMLKNKKRQAETGALIPERQFMPVTISKSLFSAIPPY